MKVNKIWGHTYLSHTHDFWNQADSRIGKEVYHVFDMNKYGQEYIEKYLKDIKIYVTKV